MLASWCLAAGVVGDVATQLSALIDYARERYMRPDQTCFWLDVRVTQSNEGCVVPRPHHDGRYWPSSLQKEGEEAFKVGTCFVGPSTIFWEAHEDNRDAHELVSKRACEKVRTRGLRLPDEEIQQWAADELDKLGVKRVQPKPGEAAMWIVSSNARSGIHSEPDMSDMPNGRVL